MTENISPTPTQIPTILKKQIRWFRQKLLSWSAINLRDFPWRRTTDPYAIFIAEVLLQKTDATTVEKIYETFLTRYPDIKAIADTQIEKIAELLTPLGLHFRAERLHRSAQIIRRRADNSPEFAVLFSGYFPDDIRGESPTERSHHLNQLLNNWQSDLETFREIIYQKFLDVA